MIIWRTLESAEVLGRKKVYFWFYHKFKLCEVSSKHHQLPGSGWVQAQ